MKVYVFQSGYCTAPGRVVYPGKGRGSWRFYATWLWVDHPTAGPILIDTGYAPRFRQATQSWPYRLYALLTPLHLADPAAAYPTLSAAGLQPERVRHILLTHFHADHVAGLADFPQAQVWCSAAAWAQAHNAKGWAAVSAGLLPGLFPDDLAARIRVFPSGTLGTLDQPTASWLDWWGDGRIRLVELPGHARGQLGALLHTNQHGTVLWAADAAWNTAAWQAQVLPRRFVGLFFDHWGAYRTTFQQLWQWSQGHPATRVWFTHCPQTLEHLKTPLS